MIILNFFATCSKKVICRQKGRSLVLKIVRKYPKKEIVGQKDSPDL